MGKNKVITKTNLIISGITVFAFLLKFVEMIILASQPGSYMYSWDIYALVILIIMIYILLWSYLSRYIGIRKGIESGYAWGYCLGIIGFIVVCASQGEKKDAVSINNTNKYEDLTRLQKLKESGAITQEEFEIEKQKILQ